VDDLKMLRDLGRDLEHDPPATLAHQRRRLLGASTGTGSRWTRRGAMLRPFGSVGAGSRRTRHWTTLGLIAAATAAVALVPALFLGGNPQPFLGGGSRSVPSPVGDRPEKRSEALNVLLIGTDSQVGTPRYRTAGTRSDTMMLLHLPADRKKITVISIPRDSMVRIPSCGQGSPARTEMINSAFRTGGLACAWKTVESLTKVRVDHAIELDFSGFMAMVDAVGGVEVRLPRAMDDPKAKLHLPAGKSLVNGEQALAYVRSRHAIGDGSDLGRLKQQAQIMRELAKKTKKLLANPAELLSFLAEATMWTKADSGLDLETMRTIAVSLTKTDPEDMIFVVVPWKPYPEDPHRLQWAQPAADQLFAAIR
jgi:LCP family protein required for cell wall assembly